MMTKDRRDRLYPRWLWPALAALACVMAASAVSGWLRSPVRAEPQGEAAASPMVGKGTVVNAVDNDTANQLWECDTRRVPFGDEQVDRLRCLSFHYKVPPGGVRSATLHVAVKPLGAEQDTDSLVAAVGQSYPDCSWAAGKMPGCVALHGGFKGDETSLDLDLLNIACDPSIQASAEAQESLRAQLQTGVLHVMLQDDTAVLGAQLVLNGGPLTFPCGTSARPNAGQPPSTSQENPPSSSFERLVTGSSSPPPPDPVAVGVAAAAGLVSLALFTLLNSLLSRGVSDAAASAAGAASRAAGSQAASGAAARGSGTAPRPPEVKGDTPQSAMEATPRTSTVREAGQPQDQPGPAAQAGPRQQAPTATPAGPRSASPTQETSVARPKLGPKEDERLQDTLDKLKDKLEGLAEPEPEENWKCAICGRTNRAQHKYCVYCGTRHAGGG